MQNSYDAEFEQTRALNLSELVQDSEFLSTTHKWVEASVRTKYSYGFNWLGVPIIQFPSDLVAFQEIVFEVKPTLIIECGVARGGSVIFWASMQHICGITPNVIGVDIDIRSHTHKAIEDSSYVHGIHLIQASSIEEATAQQVRKLANGHEKVLVVLDSNHTHDHVLAELNLYADLVTSDSYLLVLDTVIENLPIDSSRPWGPGASPQTAVLEYMKNRDDFVNDEELEQRIAITVAPKGYWRKTR